MNRKSLFVLLAAGLLAALAWAYSNHFHNAFHFDDDHTIVSNSSIRELGNIPKFFADATTTSSLPANQMYRPGLTTLNTIDYWLAGELDPFQFHVTKFINYTLLCILLYFMFLKMFNTVVDRYRNKYLALLAAGWYALHTANAETVNYIIARSDSFSTFMLIAGFVVYQYLPKLRKFHLYLIPVLTGCFVKEPAMMFAPLLLLYNLFIERKVAFQQLFTRNGVVQLKKSLVVALPAFLLSAAYFVFSRQMTPESWAPSTLLWTEYLVTQPFVMLHYFNNFLLPVNLSADTDWTVFTNPFDDRVFAGLGFVALMLLVAYIVSKKSWGSPITFGILWFFVALLPTSSIFPLSEVLNDHRTFFPYIGLVVAFSWTLSELYNACVQQLKGWMKGALAVVVAGVLAGHTYGTHERNKVWKNGLSLWHDVTNKSPGNARGLMNYGNALMGKGQYDEALDYYNQALKIWPYYSYLHINLGILYGALGKGIEAEQYFRNAISYDTNNPEGYYYFAQWLFQQGRYAEAKANVGKLLNMSPTHANGKTLHNAVLAAGDDMVASELDKALAILSTDESAENYLNLSLAYYNVGEYEKCIETSNKALALKPNYYLAYNNICSAYNALRQWESAIRACEKALELKPDFELASNNLTYAMSQLKGSN